MFILLSILAIGAGIATFIENDFGTQTARDLVYNAIWYEILLAAVCFNMLCVLHKAKMYKLRARTLFHLAFIIILIGAGVTRYFGIEGTMSIKEGEKSNIFTSIDEEFKLPFYVQLDDFVVTRYPGSKSASGYSSDVTVIDKQNSITFQRQIYMNNTLSYRGYKFYQASYGDGETTSILAINKDPGHILTYIGYALLFLGLILNLFDKKSRFWMLITKIKKMPIGSFLLFLCLFQTPSFAYSDFVQSYLDEHAKNSKTLSKEFGKVVVQASMGRMKPLDSLNREILRKLSKKETLYGMSANQVILGMFARPDIWKKVNLISVKTPKLRTILRVPKNQKLLNFNDFFHANGNYKLERYIEEATKLKPSKRGTFYNDVIKVDERINISFVVYKGKILKLFPIPDDANNKWVDMQTMLRTFDNKELKLNAYRFHENVFNRNYDKAIPFLQYIKKYQDEFGSRVMPTKTSLKSEIWFNEADIFFRLSLVYILFGFTLLLYSINSMFFNKLANKTMRSFIVGAIWILFLINSFAIGLRWYIGGHMPITTTYETMIIIAYFSIFAGLIFFRNSMLALSSSLMMAAIFMFSAYLGNIDPEITTLVPVLKSFWLNIHVSIIVASYGFFAVASMLSFITLFLFGLRSKKRVHIDTHIKNLSYITEAALILGMVLLVIGNFIGGIWANESWGRYWGWDPKETWTYISIIIYTMVIHFRLLKTKYDVYFFNVFSMVSFGSILMTYYGVNYYLAGLHSYATGDPVPIPNWVYVIMSIVVLLIIATYRKKNLKEENEEN